MQTADMILRSDSIFNAVDMEAFKGTVIINDHKITAVLKEDDGGEYIGEKTKIYELGNQTVCPGFLDNHVFFAGYVWGTLGNSTESAEEQSLHMKRMFDDMDFMEKAYKKFSELLASRGITAIKEIGFDDYCGFAEVLKKLEKEGNLMHRVNLVSQPVDSLVDYEYGIKCKKEMTGDFLRFMGYNIMVDGVIAEHDGDMLEEYKDMPGVKCAMDIPYDEIEAMVLGADARGLRCALHAEGDAAVRRTLDIYEKCRKVNGERDARHVITDLEMVSPEDVKRMAQLGVTASNYFQIMKLTPSMDELYVEETCGAERLDEIWAYRRMADAGVNLCSGTDMPLDVPCIPESVYYVSGRYFPDGTPAGGFMKEQGLSIAEVLKAWSYGGQYANFREKELGTLEAGKLADIAVFDRDIFKVPMEEMRNVEIALTICDGKVVYQKKKVACLGDNCVDFYSNLNRYYCTGNAVDFGVHMKRLGTPVSIISVTGNDRFGREMRETLETEGVDLSHFHTVEGRTAVSYMELIDKERTYGDYVEGAMEDVQFSKEDIAFAKEHDLVHTAFWGNAQKHLPEIHASGTEICFDYATEMNDPLVEETIPYVDYAFFSYEKEDDFIKGFLKEIVGKGPKIAVATFGEEGSIAWDGKEFYRYGIEEADLVNTIGAGDSFMAGFMNGILKGYSILDCQKQGAEIAAKVVSVFGPWPEKEV